MNLDRRAFIQALSAAIAGVAVAACDRGDATARARTLARPELLAALGAGPVRAIGAGYRAMTRGEQDAESLRNAIDASRPFASRFLGAADPPISQLVRADFANGHTVVVDGWILSVTEARQCALYSLA